MRVHSFRPSKPVADCVTSMPFRVVFKTTHALRVGMYASCVTLGAALGVVRNGRRTLQSNGMEARMSDPEAVRHASPASSDAVRASSSLEFSQSQTEPAIAASCAS